ncbi:hypothetical protein BDV98DRAFT_577585 [Pterulicium gracile]|uniref:Uncharacterized protein n=1 Tax=Pterulicium gracile TaxID=1884261 RepID=A0A5C3Q095_9AGAR|nr:hypothetical protein BDV98DRAFT_577585 [Pterula gracilis]
MSASLVQLTDVLLRLDTWVQGPSRAVNEVSGTSVVSCAYSVGGEGTCIFVQYPAATTITDTYSGPT